MSLFQAVLSVALAVSAGVGGTAAEPPSPLGDAVPDGEGIVVESVGAGSALEGAGLQARDRVLGWETSAHESRPLRSVLDWMWLQEEQAPRGPLYLEVEREGRRHQLEVRPGSWEARVRPVLDAAALSAWVEADRKIAEGAIEEGARLLEGLGQAAPEWPLRFWAYWQIAQVRSRAGKWDAACAAYQSSLREARSVAAEAVAWTGLGECEEARSQFEAAEQSYRSALRIRRDVDARSLRVAESLLDLGRLASDRNRLDEAATHLDEAMAIEQELAPESLLLAGVLNQVAIVAAQRGDLPRAESFFERAAALQEKLAPEGVALARTWNNLGVVAFQRSRLEAAEEHYRRALAVHSRIEPDGLEVATCLSNLGLVARERGDLDAAEDYGLQALAIEERLAPGSLSLAGSIHSLATLLYDRGALEAAERRYLQALRIEEKLSPAGREIGATLNNLGEVSSGRGRLTEAERRFRRALGIWKALAPRGVETAQTLDSLADVQRRRGRLAAARRSYEEARAIQESLAPESAALATTFNGLGRVARRSGNQESAAELFRRALEVLEAQVDRVGGSPEAKAGFRARFHAFYHDAVAALLALGRDAEAFHVLERSRARTLLAMLVERDPALAAEIPEEVERARRRLVAEYDGVQQELAALDARADRDKAEALRLELRRLREERSRMAAEIRRRSPKLADLRYLEPLDAPGLRRALDPGTVVLSFSVGDESTEVFVLTAAGLRVKTVRIGQASLRDAVENFRTLIAQGRSTSHENPRWIALLRAGRHLYDALIRPAESAIGSAARILIIPDGPLHGLPFAALVRDRRAARPSAPEGPGVPSLRGPEGRAWEYLVEWKPLHVAASGSVYAQLQRARVSAAGGAGSPSRRLVAFGDPYRPPPREARSALRLPAAARRPAGSVSWSALPASRVELEGITRLFGEGATSYLGSEATEERAKALGTGVRYVHFATHARLDDRTPLNSALVLAAPARTAAGGENGLLHAWEIMEGLRLDADLVVLSTCDSGLGRELRGEGLVGLSRAFQYAGALSVLASLWPVADETTAYMMGRFYLHLRHGLSKDEALGAAQKELISRPIRTASGPRDASSPYYWAVFQLIGDWK